MNLEQLQKQLVRAARAQAPNEQVPYAFEKRITARLAAQPALDPWALWARALWRAAVPCLIIALVSGAVYLFNSPPTSNTKSPTDEFSQEFEQTMFAGVTQSGDVW